MEHPATEPARAPAGSTAGTIAGPDLRLVPRPAPTSARPFDFAADDFAADGFAADRFAADSADEAPAPTSPSPAATSASATTPARRTVTIKGRGAERNLPWEAGIAPRRSTRLPHHRTTFQPDRLAMWAVVLGLLLVFVAAMSAH